MTNSLLRMTSAFTKPIYEEAKSILSPEIISKSKEEVLTYIDSQIAKYQYFLSQLETDTKEYMDCKKVIVKYDFIKQFTLWTCGQTESSLFQYYIFST